MPKYKKQYSFDFSYIFKNVGTRWYFYVIGLCLVALVILSLFLLGKKGKRNNLTDTQKIVYSAIFSALCFVGNALTIPVSSLLQISFISLFGFAAGYMLGAGLGFTAAFIGDFLCAIIFPTGPYSPIINVGTALWGYIPGILFSLIKGNDYFKVIIAFALGFFLNSFGVNTLGLSLMYNMPFESLIILLPVKLLVVAINCALACVLISVLKRVLPKDKFPFVVNSENKSQN